MKTKDQSKMFVIVVVAVMIVAVGGYAILDYACNPYNKYYAWPGVRKCVQAYTSQTSQHFGEVYSPETPLNADSIAITRICGIPGPSKVQYAIWEWKSEKLVALVFSPSGKSLTDEEVILMGNNRELLCGGVEVK